METSTVYVVHSMNIPGPTEVVVGLLIGIVVGCLVVITKRYIST